MRLISQGMFAPFPITSAAFPRVQLPSPVALASQEWVFRALAIGVGILAVGMIIFACIVILLRIKHQRTARHWAQREAKWEPKLLAVLAGDAAPETLWEQVREHEQREFVEYLVRFARRLKGHEREELAALAGPFLATLDEDLGHRSAERRARAVQTLGDLGFQRYQHAVIEALDDPVPLVRMIAARALARPEHPEHVDLVIQKLHSFATWSPNFLAAMLADAGEAAAGALRRAMADEDNPSSVRAITATALAYLGDLEAADVAAAVLEQRTASPDLLASSLRLLTKVGQPQHADVARAFLGASHFAVRAAAMTAVGELGDARDFPTLRAGYDDESPWVAMHAARALLDAGDIGSLEEIVARRHTRASLAIQMLSEIEDE